MHSIYPKGIPSYSDSSIVKFFISSENLPSWKVHFTDLNFTWKLNLKTIMRMLWYSKSSNDLFSLIKYSVHLGHGGPSQMKAPKLCISLKVQACSGQLSKLHYYRYSSSSSPTQDTIKIGVGVIITWFWLLYEFTSPTSLFTPFSMYCSWNWSCWSWFIFLKQWF